MSTQWAAYAPTYLHTFQQDCFEMVWVEATVQGHAMDLVHAVDQGRSCYAQCALRPGRLADTGQAHAPVGCTWPALCGPRRGCRSPQRAYHEGVRAGYIQPAARPEPTGSYAPLRLVQWHTLSAAERAAALACRDPKARFTKQETTGIEWARWSWNPVMGCEHNCSYCYARDLALLGQAQGVLAYQVAFAPALQASRLRAPATTVVPADASDDMGWKNVFTCSMADRFGRWVPRAWIEAVLAEVRANPQWNFLFLTKFPLRYAEFEFPDNAWLGTTVDAQARIANAASSAPPWPGGSGRCAGSG